MCYANYTQHSGCSHIGLSSTNPLTLCDSALHRLYTLRGPNSPPISPGATPFNGPPPKRSASRRRFFSLSGTLSRSASLASSRSRGSVNAGGHGEGRMGRATSVRSTGVGFSPSTTVMTGVVDVGGLPEHQVSAVRCREVVRRSVVAGEMSVCEGCRGAVEAMRSMVERYDKTGSIRGTAAFETFLRFSDDRNYTASSDVTVPVRDSVAGEPTGALQAIVLGHASDSSPVPQRGGTWGRDADAETLSDCHVDAVGSGSAKGPRQAVIVGQNIEGHPSEAGWLVEGGTNGLGYWKGDDVSSLATSRVFAGI